MRLRVGDRQTYSLIHKVHQAVKVGRLQTVMRVPTLPGDSMQGRCHVFVRMNPLRRPVPFDLQVAVFGFWQPLRWDYPKILDAIATPRDLAVAEAPAITSTHGACEALLLNMAKGKAFPKHVAECYGRIYNHFFKEPHQTDISGSAVFTGQDDDNNHWGLPVGALKTYHTTAMQGDALGTTTTDGTKGRFIPVTPVDTSKNLYSLDVAQVPANLARWQEEQLIEWTGVRIEELYQRLFGQRLPVDADFQPEYLGCSKRWLSSTDIDGTSGDQFGSAIGKMTGTVTWRLPRRVFREHGTLMVMVCARPLPVYKQEKHRLDGLGALRGFKDLLALPEGRHALPDVVSQDAVFWDGDPSKTHGAYPALQHYRTHPSFVSNLMSESTTGWEGRSTPASGNAAAYTPNYDNVFATLANGNGTLHCLHDITAHRLIGDVMDSIQGAD